MSFGTACGIWHRVQSEDETLTDDEVKAAAKWLDEFIGKLSEKASQSEQELQQDIRTQKDNDTIERKRKAAESDKRQLEDFNRKHDDLMNWLNTHKQKDK